MWILQALGEPGWRTLIAALLHTLWQGVLISGVVYVLLRAIPARRPRLRYQIALCGLSILVLSGFVTWGVLSLPAREAVPGDAANRFGAVSVSGGDVSQPATPTAGGASAAECVESPRLASVGSREARSPFVMPLLAAGWIAGMAVMLARAGWQIAGAYRLRRLACEVTDAELLSSLRRLEQRFHIRRPVAAAVSDVLHGPAIMGVFWPTLLIPLSMVGAMPPEAWVPILAHELAHVRRHDPLINLVQMLIEAVLFFNPAVWWLSRQIRIEREACCDALAAAVCTNGGLVEYARALGDWAERLRLPWHEPAGVSFADGSSQSLLDRVKRLVLPAYRPAMRVSWTTFAVAMFAAGVAMIALWRGTSVAVALAAKALSPEERAAVLRDAQREFAPTATAPVDWEAKSQQATIEGTIRTADSGSLPKEISLNSFSTSAQGGYGKSHGRVSSSFEISMPPGAVWLSVNAAGYAPQIIGPLSVRPRERLEGVSIVLARGFAVKLKAEDEQGKPVEDFTVKGCMRKTWGGMYENQEWESDPGGVCVLEHVGVDVYYLELRAAGFEPSQREFAFEPDQVINWRLNRSRSTTGVIVDTDGKPLAGANLRLFGEVISESRTDMPAWNGPVLTQTDADGRFSIDQFVSDHKYALLIQTAESEEQLIPDVRAGQQDLRIRMRPETVVRGTVIGDLSRLKPRQGRPGIEAECELRFGNHIYGKNLGTFPVKMNDGVARFEIGGVLPSELTLRAGEAARTVTVKDTSVDGIILDLNAKALRKVVVKLTGPAARLVEGTVSVTSNGSDGKSPWIHKELRLIKASAEFEAYAGGSLSCQSKRLVGAWFGSKNERVPEGDGPFVIEIPCAPAGAIVGRVLGPDGNPPKQEVSVDLSACKPLTGNRGGDWVNGLDNHVDRVQGTFMITPVPLTGTYRVKASIEKNMVWSDEIALDEAHATRTVELRFSKGVDAEVRVLDPQGKPGMGIPVEFSYEGPGGTGGYSPDPLTDESGRVVFKDLNPDRQAKYFVRLPIRERFQPEAETELSLDGRLTLFKLKPGLVLSGQIIDRTSQRPVPEAEVTSFCSEGGKYLRIETGAKTDAQGRFRFDNLPPGDYRVSVEVSQPPHTRFATSQDSFKAGQADPARVVVDLRDWAAADSRPAR
jgi:beta-lactamase regulating signal transducer with metallopeptidase domain